MGFVTVPDRAAGYQPAETDWDASIKDNFNTGTWVLLGATELGAANTITFASIPGTYAHLLLVGSVRGSTAALNTLGMLRFNADTGANYDSQQLFATAASAAGSEFLANTGMVCCSIPAATATAAVFTAFKLFIPHYANTTRNKAVTSSGAQKVNTSSGGMIAEYWGGQWRNNAAITQVEFRALVGPNLEIGSRIHLYAMA